MGAWTITTELDAGLRSILYTITGMLVSIPDERNGELATNVIER
ncbi:hypothetical protein BH23CHL2_BH23CHL2_11000 [soil metagenome]